MFLAYLLSVHFTAGSFCERNAHVSDLNNAINFDSYKQVTKTTLSIS